MANCRKAGFIKQSKSGNFSILSPTKIWKETIDAILYIKEMSSYFRLTCQTDRHPLAWLPFNTYLF